MRFFIIFFLIIILFIQGLLYVAFTSGGNDFLLPYVNSYLKKNVSAAKVKVLKFRLKPGTIGLVAKVNDTIDVRAKGTFSALSHVFDINYIINTNEIKTPTFTIKENISIKGTAQGDPDNMKVSGKGLAFASKIDYALRLIDNVPQDIKIDIAKANIKSILAVTGQKPYADGLLTIHANMPKIDPKNPQGDAKIIIENAHLNSKVIKEDFNISLPGGTTLTADLVAKAEKESIAVSGKVHSTLADLVIKNGAYSINSGNGRATYYLAVADMAKLKSITGQQLKGSLKLSGEVIKEKGLVSVSGITKSFGGQTAFAYGGNRLDAKLTNVQITALLYKLGQKRYMSGTANADVKLTDINDLTGVFKIRAQGTANRAVIKKEFDTDLGKRFTTNSEITGSIKKQKVSAKLTLKTAMGTLTSKNINYNIKTDSLNAFYLIDIPNMGKLAPLTGKKYQGDMRINGSIKKAKDLHLVGRGKEFGGTIDFKLLNDNLTANASGATVSKVLHMLNLPKVLEALSQAKLNYNIATQSGTLNATLDNARLLPNELTKMLKKLGIIDLTNERYNNSKFFAKIIKDKVAFTLDARSKGSHFKVSKGRLNKKTNAINIPVDLSFRGKDLQATILGTTDNPKISLNASKFLEGKVKERAKNELKKVEKKLKSKLKGELEKKVGDKVEGLIKGIF